MFENIGSKLKIVAQVVCYLGITFSIIIGFYMFDYSVSKGLLYAILGSIASWVSSLGMYAFGELVIYVKIIAKNTKSNTNTTRKSLTTEDKSIQNSKKIKKFVKDETISNEEMIDLNCPYCKEKLSFAKGTLKIYSNPVCVHCSEHICGDAEDDSE